MKAVSLELAADTLTLAGAFLRLGLENKPCFAMEKVEGGAHPARYAYLFFDPYETLRVREGALIRERQGQATILPGRPLEELKRRLEAFRPEEMPGIPPFACGAVGYLGYDCVRYLEKIPLPAAGTGEDEACFVLFRHVLVLDQVRQRAILVANGLVSEASAAMREELDAIARRLEQGNENGFLSLRAREAGPSRRDCFGASPLAMTDGALAMTGGDYSEDFTQAVARVKDHIRQGDIFQCVLSKRQSLELNAHPFDLYRKLRGVNPSPYHYYFHSGHSTLVGASPEALVKVDSGIATTCPIAGTRPRGKTHEEDARLEKNLLRSPKEKAEHLMLVDLSRNDLGRVCRPGTVKVTELMAVQRFSHVMHLTSLVEGELASGKSALDALFASFPAGTLTGAPKIRAMQIISALEKVRRGTYGGAVVLYDFSGKLDSCITIRSAVVRAGIASVQAGAGIVADSRAARELEEIHNKCGAVRRAIELAHVLAPDSGTPRKRAGDIA